MRMMAETTTTLDSIKNFDDKAAGNVILADHINEVQNEVEKIETELLGEEDSSGESRLDKIEKTLSYLQEQISKLAGTLAEPGGGLLPNTQGDKLKVARASTSSPGIVKLVDTSFTNTKDSNDAVTWGAFADVFEKKILKENGQLPSEYIPSDLMSSFVFAGVVTFEEEQGVITFDKEKLGIEDETVTSCYYLAKVSAEDQEGNPIYAIEGTCEALWPDDPVIISDGAWIQGSRDSGESDWEWFIIDRANKVVIEILGDTYEEDERGVTNLSKAFQKIQDDLNVFKDQITKDVNICLNKESLVAGVAHTGPIYFGWKDDPNSTLTAGALSLYRTNIETMEFTIPLPGGVKDFKKMRWWTEDTLTPTFEVLKTLEGEPIYLMYGMTGSSDVKPAFYPGPWGIINNSAFSSFKGGRVFGHGDVSLYKCDLHWNESNLEWQLCFTAEFSSDYKTIEFDDYLIYYEFYN